MLLLSRFSHVRLCETPETAAHQALPSLGFSRQEHWSGLPFPSPVHESEKWKWSHWGVSNSQRPHGLQPTRLLRPWDIPGKSTGVGCHCLLHSVTYVTLNNTRIHFMGSQSSWKNGHVEVCSWKLGPRVDIYQSILLLWDFYYLPRLGLKSLRERRYQSLRVLRHPHKRSSDFDGCISFRINFYKLTVGPICSGTDESVTSGIFWKSDTAPWCSIKSLAGLAINSGNDSRFEEPHDR